MKPRGHAVSLERKWWVSRYHTPIRFLRNTCMSTWIFSFLTYIPIFFDIRLHPFMWEKCQLSNSWSRHSFCWLSSYIYKSRIQTVKIVFIEKIFVKALIDTVSCGNHLLHYFSQQVGPSNQTRGAQVRALCVILMYHIQTDPHMSSKKYHFSITHEQTS